MLVDLSCLAIQLIFGRKQNGTIKCFCLSFQNHNAEITRGEYPSSMIEHGGQFSHPQIFLCSKVVTKYSLLVPIKLKQAKLTSHLKPADKPPDKRLSKSPNGEEKAWFGWFSS